MASTNIFIFMKWLCLINSNYEKRFFFFFWSIFWWKDLTTPLRPPVKYVCNTVFFTFLIAKRYSSQFVIYLFAKMFFFFLLSHTNFEFKTFVIKLSTIHIMGTWINSRFHFFSMLRYIYRILFNLPITNPLTTDQPTNDHLPTNRPTDQPTDHKPTVPLTM